MSELAREIYREFLSAGDVHIGDHSLNHERIFHYRHVIGFHSNARPLLSSPERLGLLQGSPVCIYGGELVRPRFAPSEEAVALCQKVAASSTDGPGSDFWNSKIAEQLVQSGLGFRRMGKLCIQGSYESRGEFRERISRYLDEGKACLKEFAGRDPIAFAYPWWQASPDAEKRLRELGYRMTFSGRGLCRQPGLHEIPRLFINNDTPRPIDPERLAADQTTNLVFERLRTFGRQVIYA